MNQWLKLFTNMLNYKLVHLMNICAITPLEGGNCMVTLSNGEAIFTVHTEDQIFAALGELYARNQETSSEENITPVETQVNKFGTEA